MTLDEIITGMAHTGTRSATEILLYHIPEKCAFCQLVAFRAEMEAMVRIWQKTAAQFEELAPISSRAHRECAAELRAKIGEGK